MNLRANFVGFNVACKNLIFSARKWPSGIKQSSNVHQVRICYATFNHVFFYLFLQSFIEFWLFNCFYNTSDFANYKIETYLCAKTVKSSFLFISLWLPERQVSLYVFLHVYTFIHYVSNIVQENVVLIGGSPWSRCYGRFGYVKMKISIKN